jgi:Flp pilus assembly protein TadG
MTQSLRSQNDDRGAVALEFIIVLPLLLTLIIGTVVLGVFLSEKSQTVGFAHEGARAASLGRPLPVDEDTVVEIVGDACPNLSKTVTVRATRPVSLRNIPFIPVLLKESHDETARFPCAP